MSEHDVSRGLVRRARAGDPDAWEALYRRVYPRLHAYARRRLSTPDEADDAVSETMTRAFDRIEGFRWRDGGFEAWLFVICRNIVFETNRRAGRTLAVASGIEPGLQPDEWVVADEEVAMVRDAFARLNLEERELLELRVVGGLDAKEVGRIIGKRPGAVRTAQSRALGRLKSMMEGTIHAE